MRAYVSFSFSWTHFLLIFPHFYSLFLPYPLKKKKSIAEGKRGRDQGQEGALVLLCVKLGPRQFEYSTEQHWPIFY